MNHYSTREPKISGNYGPVTGKLVLPRSGSPGPLLAAKNGPPRPLLVAKSGPPLPTMVLVVPNLATKTGLGDRYGNQKWSAPARAGILRTCGGNARGGAITICLVKKAGLGVMSAFFWSAGPVWITTNDPASLL